MEQDNTIPESRIHVVDHPFITSVLGFLEFKFGSENILAVRIETSDSEEEVAGWVVSLSFGDMIPEDMMIPGYSVIWREEFLVVLEQADEEKLYLPLVGKFKVESKIEFTEFTDMQEMTEGEIAEIEGMLREEAQKEVDNNPELQEKSFEELINGSDEESHGQEQQQEQTIAIHNHIITHPIDMGNSLKIFIEMNPVKRISKKDPISSAKPQVIKKVRTRRIQDGEQG